MKQQQLKFSLFATSEAKKLDKTWKKLKPMFSAAATEVLQTHLDTITRFELSVILQSDEELRALNIQSLDHDYYTDILTFEIDRNESTLSAELYLSLDRATENARKYKTTVTTELTRLVVHGILHLAGFADKTPIQKKRMRERERYFLKIVQENGLIE